MKLILAFFLTIIFSQCIAQSIKDFFIPSSDKNVSVYSIAAKGTGFKTWVYYVEGEHNLKRIKFNLFDSRIESKVVERMKISGDVVLLEKVKNVDVLSNISFQTFKKPNVYLKMPIENEQYSSWEFNDGNKALVKCTSVMTDVIINNETKKAIKVSKNVFEKGKLVDWASSTEYYVYGIGLYKTTVGENELFEVLEKQINVKAAPAESVDY